MGRGVVVGHQNLLGRKIALRDSTELMVVAERSSGKRWIESERYVRLRRVSCRIHRQPDGDRTVVEVFDQGRPAAHQWCCC